MRQEFVMTTSWDDGHPLDVKLAELLSKYDLNGTFYIPFQASRPCISSDQIRDLARHFEIGAHTVHHVELPNVSDSLARAEITQSKQRLEDITGRSCHMFCFPNGRFHKKHLGMVRSLGFRGVRTVELLSLKFPMNFDGLAVVPTTIQAYSHATSAYARNCLRRWRPENLFRLFELGRSRTWEALAARLLEGAYARGGIFHLWGHSWEIEAAHQWEKLECVLALMGQIAKDSNCLTNSEICRYAN